MLRLSALLLFLAAPLCAQENPRFSCLATNHPIITLDAKTGKYTDHEENWEVTCTVTYKGDKLYSGGLVLPQYATMPEAKAAIEEFRKKKLPEILKGIKK